MGIENINVRFFVLDFCEDSQEFDYIEVDEQTFINAEGAIEYERHTIFENGVNQICLTKSEEF